MEKNEDSRAEVSSGSDHWLRIDLVVKTLCISNQNNFNAKICEFDENLPKKSFHIIF